jgi:hypothetical protein
MENTNEIQITTNVGNEVLADVMRSANLLRENTEIRDQQHEMCAEGSCDDEPTKEEVIAFVKTLGWVGRCVDISFDCMQTVWRWNCDIAHL